MESTASSSKTGWFSNHYWPVRFECDALASDLNSGFPVGLKGDDFAVPELKHKLAHRVKSCIGLIVPIAIDAFAFSTG